MRGGWQFLDAGSWSLVGDVGLPGHDAPVGVEVGGVPSSELLPLDFVVVVAARWV